MTPDDAYRFWITLDRIEELLKLKNLRAVDRLIASEKRELERARAVSD